MRKLHYCYYFQSVCWILLGTRNVEIKDIKLYFCFFQAQTHLHVSWPTFPCTMVYVNINIDCSYNSFSNFCSLYLLMSFWHIGRCVTHGRQQLKWPTLIARFMGPTWGPSEADRTQVGPMLAPWTLLSGQLYICVQECTELMQYPHETFLLLQLCSNHYKI